MNQPTDVHALLASSGTPCEPDTGNPDASVRNALRLIAFHLTTTGGIAGARRAVALWSDIESELSQLLDGEPLVGSGVSRLRVLLGPADAAIETRAQRFVGLHYGYPAVALVAELLGTLGGDLNAEEAWNQRSVEASPAGTIPAETLAQLDRLRAAHEGKAQ